ncbi:MFS transporter [Virgibacillus alimentarius]|uniref:MFS transporter n=1 Tax=Virgibacillus alimentarius TaxID=698769 RepID=UPI0004935477|nr:MFS transporter [Virgibacillus alimentarius]
MTSTKLWTKDFLIVSTANFFLYFTFYLLMATISVFAVDQFQATPSEAGLASSIFIIGILIARIFAGGLVDTVGQKKILYIGFIFTLLTNFLYFTIDSLMFLYLIRLLNGAALGIASTATGTIVASIIPKQRHGEGIGYYALSITLAAAVGPFLGMFIHQHADFSINFILCIILLGFSFICSFFLTVPKSEITKEQLEDLKGFKRSSFLEPRTIPIAIIAGFMGLGYASILSFINSYAIAIDVVDIASFFFIFYAVATLVSRPFVGRWFDTKGENFVMYPAFLLFAMAFLILSFADIQGYLILLAGIFVGLGYGTFLSSAQAIAVKESPKHRIGLATSTYYIFLDTGLGIGPFFLGFLIPVIGFKGLYISMAGLTLVGGCVYYFLHGKKASQHKESTMVSTEAR